MADSLSYNLSQREWTFKTALETSRPNVALRGLLTLNSNGSRNLSAVVAPQFNDVTKLSVSATLDLKEVKKSAPRIGVRLEIGDL